MVRIKGSWHSRCWAVTLVMLALVCAAMGVDGAPPAPTPADARGIEYDTWHTLNPGEYSGYNQRASLVQRGRLVYNQYCVGCHGESGDGKGPAAARLITKPRDFTSGIYKFRSTDSGSLPLDSDLFRTITRGLPGVSMPGFPLIPERDKLAVIEYVKHFYPRWDERAAKRVRVFVPQAPADLRDNQRVLRGRIVYMTMQCFQCHGVDGQGAKATQTMFTDAWGHPQKPFNFTRGRLKGGDDPEDIYRTFHAGLQSVMPAFDAKTLAAVSAQTFDTQKAMLDSAEAQDLTSYLDQYPKDTREVFGVMNDSQRLTLGERNSWDLVAYILSLRTPTTTAKAVLGAELPGMTPDTAPPAEEMPGPAAAPVSNEDY